MSSTRKRLTIALGGAAALGLAVASAASLGPLNTRSLGASDNIVQSCDQDGVTVAYDSTYDSASGRYRTTGVNFTGMAAPCTGLSLSVTLRDANGLALSSATTTVTGASQLVAVPPVAAEAVAGTAVVITG
jgi:hypothetical protein